MDPGTIVNSVSIIISLLQLLRDACNQRWARSTKRRLDELQLFCKQLDQDLQYVKEIKALADTVSLKPKAFETLQSELQELVSSAKALFYRNGGCKKEDIRELRERTMRKLQERMACAQTEMGIKSFEIQSKTHEELKAIKEMMVKKQEKEEMMSKEHVMPINSFQEQARGNPVLTGPLSSERIMPYPTETFSEPVSRVPADGHRNRIVPTEASKEKDGTYVCLIGVAGDPYAGMVKGVEESDRLMKKGAPKDAPEEEEELEKKNTKEKKNFLMKEGAGKDVLEEKKNKRKGKEVVLTKEGAGKDGLEEDEKRRRTLPKVNLGEKITELNDSEKLEGAGKEVLEEDNKIMEALSEKDKEKQGQITTKLKDNDELDNPNCNMEVDKEEGKGELLVSKHMGSGFEMTYKWCGESMRMVIGKKPMEVSKTLGYYYFEVQLVKMAELSNGKETRLAGVGVGLARSDKFTTSKMAGKYPKSCGYDGRVGEVYCESRVQGTSKLGCLAEGDTLGIGLLQHHGQDCIFFAKNGDLRVCIQDHSLGSLPPCVGLYPVISLASAHVQIHVRFHGLGQISKLLGQVKATLHHK